MATNKKRYPDIPPTIVFMPRYGGEKSREFWRVLNALPESEAFGAYAMGCALQDLESRVLKFLVEAQDRHALSIARRGKRGK